MTTGPNNIRQTRKRGNCECIATRGNPTPRTSYPFNFVARVKFELAQPIRCRLRAFLLLISYVTLWPWTLTPWPWPWTFVVCRLYHGQTLYQIWANSGNPRQSYCSLNIWPYDLEHLSRVALYSGIVCTKFNFTQAIRLWNVTIFDANTSYHAMTLTFDPLTLKLCGRSGVTWS